MWLQNSVLLSINVCHLIWNSGVPIKWQTWRNSMSASNFALQWGKNATETFGEWAMGRTQVFEWFSKFKSSVILVEDAEHLGHPLMSKTMGWVKELVLENTEITLHEWWFNFCKFRAFWKTIWLCIGLSPNLCSQCWVRSRRRIVSVCAKTFKKGLKEVHNSFWR